MATKTVTTALHTFTIREITVNELRTWWNKIATPGHACDVINEFAVPGISLDDLAILCDCTADDFNGLTFSELDSIVTVAKEMNPHVFRARELLTESCAKLTEILGDAFTTLAKEQLQ